MSAIVYLTILRLIHIFTGVFWAGGSIYLAGFVAPAVQASGPEGTKFMQQLAKTNKLPQVMFLVSSLNVISGILLLWKLSEGFQGPWMGSLHGIVLSTGGTIAIISYLIAMTVTRPTVMKLATLGQQIAKTGAPPDANQMQQLMGFRKKIFSANRTVAILLSFTIVGMSIARYL